MTSINGNGNVVNHAVFLLSRQHSSLSANESYAIYIGTTRKFPRSTRSQIIALYFRNTLLPHALFFSFHAYPSSPALVIQLITLGVRLPLHLRRLTSTPDLSSKATASLKDYQVDRNFYFAREESISYKNLAL